jgi:chemotaxis protein CheC
MLLTDQQRDAMSEIINIAFARTAASLSELSGHRVLLAAPGVEIVAIDELPAAIGTFINEEIVSVHQVFNGPVAGDALLMLNHTGAIRLTDLLCESRVPSQKLDESAREALTEVGNILLNACLGVFGNLLQVHVGFSMPRLHLEHLGQLIRSITIGAEELRYAVVVSAAFGIQENSVSGYLAIVLGVSSLDRLLRAIEDWEKNQNR